MHILFIRNSLKKLPQLLYVTEAELDSLMESEYRAKYIPLFEQYRQNYSTNAWLNSTQTLLSDVNLLITVQKPKTCYFLVPYC